MTVKDSVLKSLRKNSGTFLSGEELSNSLNVSRAAVWKAINSLRDEGFKIEAVKNRGYMLQPKRNAITADSIRMALPPELKNNDIYVYDCLDSTNLEARRLLADEVSPPTHGAVVIAGRQSSGRGRLGRSFYSPDSGLYLSIIIRPDFDMEKSTLVTVATAAAVSDAVASVCGVETEIKWVNDVLYCGKKICGILTEATTDFELGQIDHLIIGIGVNTAETVFPEELADIAAAVPGDYSNSQLAAKIVENTLKNINELSQPDPNAFMDSYRKRNLVPGHDIKVYKGSYRKNPAEELGGITAKALSIHDNGGLEVMYTDGKRETLTSGEISIRLK